MSDKLGVVRIGVVSRNDSEEECGVSQQDPLITHAKNPSCLIRCKRTRRFIEVLKLKFQAT